MKRPLCRPRPKSGFFLVRSISAMESGAVLLRYMRRLLDTAEFS